MDNPRPEKVAIVEEVRQHFDASDAAILTEYRGLKVKDLAGLRRSLRSSGGEYKIYKNTLVTLAAKQSGLTDLEGLLKGPIGITFINGDAAAVAKVLRDYSKTNPLLVIRGGVLGEKVISSDETTALADLPSREVLLAQLAGAIAAPMQQFAGLLQALPRNLAYGLAALRDKLAEGAPPETVAPLESAEPEAADGSSDEAPADASESPADASDDAPAPDTVSETPSDTPEASDSTEPAAEPTESDTPTAEQP